VLLYIGQVVKPVDEVILENLTNLANLVLSYGSMLLMAEGVDIPFITALALIFVLLAARIVKRKRGILKFIRARGGVTNKGASRRLFEGQRSPLKQCPNCAEQLPLSAIICETCDYNFLAERPGRGQRLLSPPQPMTGEVPEQKIAPVT
jgi:hypothetical protein